MSALDDKLKELDLEALKSFYYTHSDASVCEQFNLRKYMLSRILERFSIPKKTKEQSAEIIRNSIINKSLEEKSSTEEKRKQTCLKKYGVDNPSKDSTVQKKISDSITLQSDEDKAKKVERFRKTMSNKSEEELALIRQHRSDATSNHFNDMSLEEKESFSKKMSSVYANLPDDVKAERARKIAQSLKAVMISKYGVDNPMKMRSCVEALSKRCLEENGVPYYCMTDACRQSSGANSRPNLAFKKILEDNGFEFSREFRIGNYSYDFKVGNILIEIDPTATHNVTWSPFGEPISKTYHRDKSRAAKQSGFRCIHIFDWDDVNKIISLLKKRKRIYARQCEVCEISKEDAVKFLNEYHLQGYAKDSIRLGLKHSNELVAVMTFGKPRYNKNFEYELVRFCSKDFVVGGAEKLFKYFKAKYNPTSVISYCDASKFDGKVYTILGFVQSGESLSSHWYSMSTKTVVNNNLLLQRGFDQLFGTSFGKGTSNEELMIDNGFVEVYDAGQLRFEYVRGQ